MSNINKDFDKVLSIILDIWKNYIEYFNQVNKDNTQYDQI